MLGATLKANEYLARLNAEVARVDQRDLQQWSDLIYQAWERDRCVFIFGNGGSGTTASHMAEDLGKSTLRPSDLHDESRKRLKVLSLTDNAGWIMAVGNDLAYDEIFVQQLMNYGRADDVVIAISGSGNSPNVLKAVDWSNRHGLVTFGLTGYKGGKLKAMQRYWVKVYN
ncbi:MAG: SIS domain-containing protein, partial [Pirellulaceae bacterium]